MADQTRQHQETFPEPTSGAEHGSPLADEGTEAEPGAWSGWKGTWVGAPVRAVERHPLVAVAVVASIVAAGHAIWVLTHRRLGALDPDEAGYIATALRFQRSIDPAHPLEFVRSVMSGGNGPLVPLLAVPLLILGPRSHGTVMIVQPLLLVFTCVSIAGATRRMTGPVTAFATGCSFLALPSAALATQSFWLGLGATACMTGAAWALVASERLTNRWTYAFGLATACMALSRTMTLAFVPGLFAAAAVLAGRDRRSWLGVARALGVMIVVAAPWYVLQREAIFGYLIDYGYSDRAGLFGSGGPLDRLAFRFDRISGDIGTSIVWTMAIIAATGIPIAVARYRKTGALPRGTREAGAFSLAVLIGLAALVSTSNNGVWFELPLIGLMLAIAGFIAYQSFLVLRIALGVQLIGQAVLVLAVTWWVVEPAAGLTAHYEQGFAQYDERYEQGRRDEQPEAARDWWELNESVEEAMRQLDGGTGLGALFTVSGNMQLFNSNTLSLAGELQGWGPAVRIPDTTLDPGEREPDLDPQALGRDGREVERILVVALHDKILFTPDAEVEDFYRQALDAGWERTQSFPMPGGGQVVILRHPAGSPDRELDQTNG